MTQHEPTLPGERPGTAFSPEQRGWLAVALVAFVGVVFIGPAYAAAAMKGRRMTSRASERIAQTGRRIRRLGGGGPMKQVFRSGR